MDRKVPSLQISPGEECPAVISHASNPNAFFVHILDDPEQRIGTKLAALLQEMNDFYHENARLMRVDAVAPGMIVAAIYSEDNSYYRAEIISVEISTLSVLYIDYGNIEKVSHSNVFKLTDTFLQIPCQALRCFLSLPSSLKATTDLTPWSKEFRKLVAGNFTLVVIEQLFDGARVKLFPKLAGSNKYISINDIFAENIKESSVKSTPNVTEAEPELRPYVVTHYESPSEIFVRPAWMNSRWATFGAEVSNALKKAPKARRNLRVGENVGIFHITWRRGTIVDVMRGKATVRLVDSGQIMTSELSQLKELPAELRTLNAFCHCVRIANVTPAESDDGASWSPSAVKAVDDFISDGDGVSIRLAGKIEDYKSLRRIPVHMSVTKSYILSAFEPTRKISIDVADWLCDERLATKNSLDGHQALNSKRGSEMEANPFGATDWRRPLVPKQDFYGRVTYVDKECHIYVVPISRLEKLRAIEAELSTFCQQSAATTACASSRVNECIFAKYPKSDLWCRGKVTEISTDRKERPMLKVLYVDYGEEKWVYPNECCGNVPQRFLDIPIMALRCKLDGVAPKSGKYSTEFLDGVHAEIVERDVFVKRANSTSVFPLPIALHLGGDSGKDLAQKFIEEGACCKV